VLQAENTQFWDETYHAYTFDLLRTQAEYYFTFANGMRALAFRARNETSFVQGNNQVPFYLQPTLGSPDDLRGYDRYRFYGNGSSVLSAEYRWSVAETLELAVFADGGNVYQRPGLIGVRDARGDGGIGFRFKNKEATFMRFDIGVSSEGVHVSFVFNPVFGQLHQSF
jgi:hemolysin activation/secretion protein